MNTTKFQILFPLGSHLCREPMPPMSELKKDMENLKKHGFNLVKLQEHWQVDEPLEGHYDFSRYEELIEHAAKLDLGIYLGLTCEQAPSWLWQKYPGCRMVGRNGYPILYEAQATLPGDGKPGPCFDHPGASADQDRFITKLVQVLGKYENIAVWNTNQEIAYRDWLWQSVCYCPHTLEMFRAWLKETFGDLDGLNRAWNTRYLDWKYVDSDRFPSGHPLPQNVSWNYFMANVQMANILKKRAAAIRRADPFHRPVFAHMGGMDIGSGVIWNYARCQDFLGSSTYPAWHHIRDWDDDFPRDGKPFEKYPALLSEMYDGLVLKFDYIRSANRHGAQVWGAEFQGGPVSGGFSKGRVPLAGDIRRWFLASVGSGMTGISFWVTRAEIMAGEQNGFSLLDSKGDTTERFEEASRIGKALNKHADLFGRSTTPQAPAAILVNEWNYRFCQIMTQGGGNLSYSTRGWHRMLWDANIPVDFIETFELDEDYIHKYKAIILPFALSLSEKVAEQLTRYVKNGGHLISEAAPGRIDENCYCNRGELSPKLAELFGVEQQSFTMVREPGNGKRWSPPERTWGEFVEDSFLQGAGPLAGSRVRANVYIEIYKPLGSTPVLMANESVAGTCRKVGKGTAWLLGTFVGHNATAYRDPESQEWFRTLFARCGLKPEHPGKLILRKRVIKNKEAWLFTNPTAGDITETIGVKGWKKVEDLLNENLQRTGDTLTLTVNSLDIKVLIVSR
jgi:beta-galactosidase